MKFNDMLSNNASDGDKQYILLYLLRLLNEWISEWSLIVAPPEFYIDPFFLRTMSMDVRIAMLWLHE